MQSNGPLTHRVVRLIGENSSKSTAIKLAQTLVGTKAVVGADDPDNISIGKDNLSDSHVFRTGAIRVSLLDAHGYVGAKYLQNGLSSLIDQLNGRHDDQKLACDSNRLQSIHERCHNNRFPASSWYRDTHPGETVIHVVDYGLNRFLLIHSKRSRLRLWHARYPGIPSSRITRLL